MRASRPGSRSTCRTTKRRSTLLTSARAFGLAAVAALAGGFPAHAVQAGELFGGEVSICASDDLTPLLERGLTGYVELDTALRPTLAGLDGALAPYAMEMYPDPRRMLPRDQGGTVPWEPLCPQMIPPGALFYTVRRVPGSYDPPVFYPRHPMTQERSVIVARYMVGDRLTHVEIKARPKRRIIDARR